MWISVTMEVTLKAQDCLSRDITFAAAPLAMPPLALASCKQQQAAAGHSRQQHAATGSQQGFQVSCWAGHMSTQTDTQCHSQQQKTLSTPTLTQRF
jgi:hypothetical protein